MLSRYMIHKTSRPWHIASQVGTAAVGNGYIGPPATHANRGDPVYSGATEAERERFRMPFNETLETMQAAKRIRNLDSRRHVHIPMHTIQGHARRSLSDEKDVCLRGVALAVTTVRVLTCCFGDKKLGSRSSTVGQKTSTLVS
jgi:hypothetical protein